MNAYTISKLAEDAGVSVHIVRHYEQRGLLTPCRCTPSGYRIYDKRALERLGFALAGKEAGIPLDELAMFVKAIEAGDRDALREHLGRLEDRLHQQSKRLAGFKRALTRIRKAAPDKKSGTHTTRRSGNL